MDLILFAIWILLFFIIPLFLLMTSNKLLSCHTETSKIIAKLLFSFFAHILATLGLGLFLLLLIVGAEPRRGRELSLGEVLLGVLTVICYSIIGWLLCSFINGKFIKSWSFFYSSSDKLQSIFDDN